MSLLLCVGIVLTLLCMHYLLFSICFCCLQRKGASGQQSLDLRSWPSCVVLFVYGDVVSSPQCTNLCIPGCTEQCKLHYSVYAWCFVLRVDKFLPQRVGRFAVNWDMMFIGEPPEFLRCSRDIAMMVLFRFLISSSLSTLDLLEVLTKVMHLSVETFSVLNRGGRQTEVK